MIVRRRSSGGTSSSMVMVRGSAADQSWWKMEVEGGSEHEDLVDLFEMDYSFKASMMKVSGSAADWYLRHSLGRSNGNGFIRAMVVVVGGLDEASNN